jgi:hypothetical protein
MSDCHHVLSPVEELPDGCVVHECIACRAEFCETEHGWAEVITGPPSHEIELAGARPEHFDVEEG